MDPGGREGGREGAEAEGRVWLSVPEPKSPSHRGSRPSRAQSRPPGCPEPRPPRPPPRSRAAPGLGCERCGRDGGGGARASAAASFSSPAAGAVSRACGCGPRPSAPALRPRPWVPAEPAARAAAEAGRPHHAAGPRAPVRLPARALCARAQPPRSQHMH